MIKGDVSIERVLGRLEAHNVESKRRLERIEKKVDGLHHFKWKAIGFTSAFAMVISVVLEYYVKTKGD